jgi:hypothetical protein
MRGVAEGCKCGMPARKRGRERAAAWAPDAPPKAAGLQLPRSTPPRARARRASGGGASHRGGAWRAAQGSAILGIGPPGHAPPRAAGPTSGSW